ncbi:MAG: N-acetylmuramoyl-L-alanine amidase [Desulfobacteraceae bacterium]|nr:N-acetylmuramoyl-L-alanine amidase [Desulfobacteraceae bacterium]
MKNRRLIHILFICLICVLGSCVSTGAAPNQLYFEAESCHRQLQKHPERQKYRSYWLKCIERFDAVHDRDPDGPWAAAGLYKAASLYRELYRHSYRSADLRAAASRFQQVIRKYPESAYRQKARVALKDIGDAVKADEKAAKQAYFEAESCYRQLQQHPERQKYRSYWMKCIERFKAVHQRDPEGPWAAAGLFMTAQLYQELYSHSRSPADEQKARSLFKKVAGQYPSSAYSRRARKALDASATSAHTPVNLAGEDTASGEVTTNHSDSSNAPAAGEAVTVTGIRYWSNPEYTRVVIDANHATDFKHNLLKKDPSINQMNQRLYVDLDNTRLANHIQEQIAINDTLLKDVRAGQYRSDTVRVVVDIKSFEDYNVFSLKNPFRIVIDVRGQAAAEKQGDSSDPEISSSQKASIARQLALGVRRIVIDAGHGGKDYGAPGYLKGVHEKNVVLEISKKLAARLREELGCEVLLTRDRDVYLTLEERTAIANTKKADLFISIHANAARNRNAYGIETYFLNLTTDEDSIAVAARENATSEKNISELQTILDDLMRNAKINESSRLATYVHKDLIGHLDGRYSRIHDKGVKQAPFYVLLGAQMPSILIETAFISNKRGCQRLTNSNYQKHLCDGIVKGVRRYIRDTRPTAFLGSGGDGADAN